MSSIFSLIWWASKISSLMLFAFVGVFASNWANDFKEESSIFSHNSFNPFRNTLIFAILSESLCIYIENQIKRQEKLNDPIYNLGLESLNNHKQEIRNQGKKLKEEELNQEIINTKLEIEKDDLQGS